MPYRYRMILRAKLRLNLRRKNGISSDYRPTFLWEESPEHHSGRIIVDDESEILPGENGYVRIEPLVSSLWENVRVGTIIRIHEGSKFVGTVEILEILEDK